MCVCVCVIGLKIHHRNFCVDASDQVPAALETNLHEKTSNSHHLCFVTWLNLITWPGEGTWLCVQVPRALGGVTKCPPRVCSEALLHYQEYPERSLLIYNLQYF